MFLAILLDAELSQEHAGNVSLLPCSSKRVGFHYINFCPRSVDSQSLHREPRIKIIKLHQSVTNFG